MRSELLIAALLVAGTPAAADPACATVSDANLPSDLRAWAQPKAPLAAAAGAADAPLLTPGTPAAVTLHPAASVRFARPPEQARDAADPHAGIVRLHVAEPGTYRLSAGTALWIDLVRDGAAVPSSAHSHMAPCTSIRKTVEFPLSRGNYLVQLSGNAGPSTQLMVTRKP